MTDPVRAAGVGAIAFTARSFVDGQPVGVYELVAE